MRRGKRYTGMVRMIRRYNAVCALLLLLACAALLCAAAPGVNRKEAGPEEMAHTLPQETAGITAPELPEEQDETDQALPEQGYCRADVPLSPLLQGTLRTMCGIYGVPYEVALGLIQYESGFDTQAVNEPSGCYGLCQLNPKYFPEGLTPEENIAYGMEYLGRLIREYGDVSAALTAYHAGYDNGDRAYADVVLAYAGNWVEKGV